MAATFCIILVISSLALLPTLEATCFNVGGFIALGLTPRDDRNNIRPEYVSTYARLLKDKNMDGVAVLTETGEGPTLNLAESMTLLDAWIEAGSQFNLSIVLGVGGGMPLPDVLALAQYGEEKGVDAILVRGDAFYSPQTTQELLYYVEIIANNANRTAVIIEDTYQDTCGYVDIVEFVRLATDKICNFRGVMSTVLENLVLLQNVISGEQKLFAGSTFLLGPEVLLGIEDYMLDVFNIFPQLTIDIIKTGQSSRKRSREMSLSLYRRLLDLYDFITREGKRVAFIKETILLLNNIPLGIVGPPLIPLTEREKYNLKRGLEIRNVKISYSADCALFG